MVSGPVTDAVGELDAAGVLDAVEHWHGLRVDAEVRISSPPPTPSPTPPTPPAPNNSWTGTHLWRDPYRTLYLLDHTGTRKLDNTEPAAEHDTLTIEFHDDENGVRIIDQPDHAA